MNGLHTKMLEQLDILKQLSESEVKEIESLATNAFEQSNIASKSQISS